MMDFYEYVYENLRMLQYNGNLPDSVSCRYIYRGAGWLSMLESLGEGDGEIMAFSINAESQCGNYYKFNYNNNSYIGIGDDDVIALIPQDSSLYEDFIGFYPHETVGKLVEDFDKSLPSIYIKGDKVHNDICADFIRHQIRKSIVDSMLKGSNIQYTVEFLGHDLSCLSLGKKRWRYISDSDIPMLRQIINDM